MLGGTLDRGPDKVRIITERPRRARKMSKLRAAHTLSFITQL